MLQDLHASRSLCFKTKDKHTNHRKSGLTCNKKASIQGNITIIYILEKLF